MSTLSSYKLSCSHTLPLTSFPPGRVRVAFLFFKTTSKTWAFESILSPPGRGSINGPIAGTPACWAAAQVSCIAGRPPSCLRSSAA